MAEAQKVCLELLSSLGICSRNELLQRRHGLFQALNGDAFYRAIVWPRKFSKMLWQRPIGDKEAFELTLFLKGNGCSGHLAAEWIILSNLLYGDCPNSRRIQAEKRARQVQYILDSSVGNKINEWFYYDMNRKGLHFLNRNKKQ